MLPYTQVHNGEMFLTYAESEDEARTAFADHGLPAHDTAVMRGGPNVPARVRVQPARKASKFKYTLDGETVTATVVDRVPPDFQDDPGDDATDDWSEVETPDVLSA